MDPAKLRNLIDDARSFSYELDHQRERELAYYEAQPRGDEREGYSRVVSHTVEETVEWALPLIIEAFMIPEPVRFVPTGPDDVKSARLETDTIQRLLFDSRGFETLYSWVKDALLHHNGIVKVWVEDVEQPTFEEYRDLDSASVAAVLSQPGVEVVEFESESDSSGTVSYLRVRRIERKPELRWEAVPPEEFLITPSWASIHLDDCPFVAHARTVTRSELVEMGFDADLVAELPADSDDADTTDTELVRNRARTRWDDSESPDPSTEPITLYECYVLYDSDDDGIAERHRILYAGNEILSDELADQVPFVAIASQLMPHRFEGRSLAQTVLDLQDISTTLWRQTLDNLYLTNNPRLKVAKGGGVNMDDLVTGGPGSPIRMRDINAVQPIEIPFSASASLPILEYVDKKRGDRTGVGETYTGQTPDVSNRAAQQAVERLMSAAEQKIRLIARVIAEVGLCSVYRKAHQLLRENFTGEMLVPYRADWEQVEPARWRPRERLVTQVGLGHASRLERRDVLNQLIQLQLGLVQQGGMGTIVSLENIYNAVNDLLLTSGIDTPERFVLDPSHPAVSELMLQNQLKPDPQTLALQLEAQRIHGDQQIKAAEVQVKAQEVEAKARNIEAEIADRDAQIELKRRELAMAEESARAQIEREIARLELERGKLLSAITQRDVELEAERKQLEARIAQANAQIEMQQLKLAQEELKLQQQAAKSMGIVPQASKLLAGPVEIVYQDGKVAGMRYSDGTARYIIEDDQGRPVGLSELERVEPEKPEGAVIIIYDGDRPIGVRYSDGSVRYIIEDEQGKPIGLSEPKLESPEPQT